MLIGEIEQKGTSLSIKKVEKINQHSGNLQIKITFTDSYFTGCALSWVAGVNNMNITKAIEYDAEQKIINIPPNCLGEDGRLFLGLIGVKVENDKTITLVSDPIGLFIEKTLNPLTTEIEYLPNWQNVITDFVIQLVDTVGMRGDSAYQVAVNNGYVGTEEEWLASLRYDHSDEFETFKTQIETDLSDAQNVLNENKQHEAIIESKYNELDKNIDQKTLDFNNDFNQSMSSFNDNSVQKTSEFNSNVATKTQESNDALNKTFTESIATVEQKVTEASNHAQTAHDEAIKAQNAASSLTVDAEMSDSSTNAVQNKIIKQYVDKSSGFVDFVVEDNNGVLTSDMNRTKALEIINSGKSLRCIYKEIRNLTTIYVYTEYFQDSLGSVMFKIKNNKILAIYDEVKIIYHDKRFSEYQYYGDMYPTYEPDGHTYKFNHKFRKLKMIIRTNLQRAYNGEIINTGEMFDIYGSIDGVLNKRIDTVDLPEAINQDYYRVNFPLNENPIVYEIDLDNLRFDAYLLSEKYSRSNSFTLKLPNEISHANGLNTGNMCGIDYIDSVYFYDNFKPFSIFIYGVPLD